MLETVPNLALLKINQKYPHKKDLKSERIFNLSQIIRNIENAAYRNIQWTNEPLALSSFKIFLGKEMFFNFLDSGFSHFRCIFNTAIFLKFVLEYLNFDVKLG